MKQLLKWTFFPGMNLHARQRYDFVPRKWGDVRGKKVLDAGFGNGMLSHKLYKEGCSVVGCSIKDKEVASCEALFFGFLNCDRNRLQFKKLNLYEPEGIVAEHGDFDMIVCCDVIEHIVDHKRICRSFFEMLKPGGTLILTTPHAEHPYNASFPLDEKEGGGHVRPGYTEKDFQALLQPIGFEIAEVHGFGGAFRQYFDDKIKVLQERFGVWAGTPMFFCSLPFLFLDPEVPKVPFSIYCRAIKPVAGSVRD